MQSFYRKTTYDWIDAMNDSSFVDKAPFTSIKYCGISWEGHIHGNIPPFEIGPTKLLTIQLGYVRYNEHASFLNDVIIDLGNCGS